MDKSRIGVVRFKGKDAYVSKELAEIIEEIKTDNRLILVEGVKDEKALIEIGIDKNRIIKCSSLTTFRIREKIGDEKSVINMMDYDKKGIAMTNRLKKELSDVYIDDSFRKKIFALLKTSFVEGLSSAIKKNSLRF